MKVYHQFKRWRDMKVMSKAQQILPLVSKKASRDSHDIMISLLSSPVARDSRDCHKCPGIINRILGREKETQMVIMYLNKATICKTSLTSHKRRHKTDAF